MDSSFEGSVLDPSKCSKLSMEEKRELVHEISKRSHGAPEMLKSWSRRDLLQILCAEMGKERKYTGLTKFKMIEHLLRIVSEKKSMKHTAGEDLEPQPLHEYCKNTAKRQRKTDRPSQLPIAENHFSFSNGDGGLGNTVYCQNSACRATVRQEDAFCKRCSCCICCQYDDNKDPSLWLVCNSEPPYQGDSCGMSCHLECALKHVSAGIAKDGQHAGLDGSFCCVFCGKTNDLLGCWRKQLMIAKDTRRVDILCYRVSLSQKLFSGTKKYLKLYEIVDTVVKKLEAEVGPVAGLPVKMARSIVNRLSSGPEIQKLCAFAVESLESMLSCSILHPPPDHKIQESSLMSSNLIRFEDVCPTSLTVVLDSEDASLEGLVGYTLWHSKADVIDYPAEPTCTLFTPNAKFLVSDLTPGTEYQFKVVSFCGRSELGVWEIKFTTSSAGKNASKSLVIERSQIPATNCSSPSNRSLEEDESDNIIAYVVQNDNPTGKCSSYCKRTDKTDSGKLCDAIKNISNAQNTSTGSGQEGSPGDSVSVLDEEHVMGEEGSMIKSTIQTESQRDSTNSTNGHQVFDALKPENKHSAEDQLVEEMSTDNGSNTLVRKDMEIVPFVHSSDSILAYTSCKVEIGEEGLGRSAISISCDEELDDGSGKAEEPQVGSSSKKRRAGCPRDGPLEGEYEYCVKVIRMLECEGHIEKNFRVKFLTWYSLRATPQERRIVKVFVDTLIDDPACLAGQLVDTFLEGISSTRPPAVSTRLFPAY